MTELVLQQAQCWDVQNHKLRVHKESWQHNTDQPEQAFNPVLLSPCAGRPQSSHFYRSFGCRAEGTTDSPALLKRLQERRELVQGLPSAPVPRHKAPLTPPPACDHRPDTAHGHGGYSWRSEDVNNSAWDTRTRSSTIWVLPPFYTWRN